MSNDTKEDNLDLDQSSEPLQDESIETDSYEELLEKNENLEKSFLRATADLDNAIKRTASEVEKAHKYGVEKLLNELLPVVDNIEHALDKLSEDASDEDREGLELTLKSFESALDKFGMRPIYPDNEQFNPEKHEAVSVIPNEDKEDGMVGDIFQRGWELHNRILRPARVTVIKN
ncbi:nucleotide exchange factor GrpE [Gammaproteobacteria bacterium]|nr:nucleotide exchange factor GrpE [Gammaproteobacteria bacterium]MDA8856307.1 nucleotide exchange factor GrpE [Gammaproteobacteria bacterium]MDA9011108.1 nucleotide exchange factor GrpE [Gammaproteobacteria bacterium]MDA9038436.1 nucleotide exchange factor GrpE [Gammaproteobacteria bacterium]MDA9044531.1 nucleotide exchange factor GrpE [Gammaproteobacteria bacterium]|tara:strand:+ start:4009 stop:4533 length:525 start_codon:yes stop_codon:yes gene_type:complete